LSKLHSKSRNGAGWGVIFLVLVLLVVLVALVRSVTSREGPTIIFKKLPKGLSQRTELVVGAQDEQHNVKALAVEVVQEGQVVHQVGMAFSARPRRWWKFWSRGPVSTAIWTLPVGHEAIPGLKEGRATLRITALNDSWGRFFRGGGGEAVLELPVRLAPPQVEVLTLRHYINQGGCDLVVFKVSPGTIKSGVEVGDFFFPSWPVKESLPETRLCVFAYAYNVDPSTTARIVASDDAGNETLANFTYQVFPKNFHSDTITLTDDFINRVLPPIMSQTPELRDQGSLLENFLEVNRQLRANDARRLVELSTHTSPKFLWSEPFIRMPSKTEANFADYRTYMYNGQVVDHQTHLGFDLAGVEHMPVAAANDGVVVFARFLGIFGNAVVLDHGCGLQSLYGHMSAFAVKEGDQVKRGQVIGRSGQTGLAAGDHVHFTILLDGIPVNPVEWWDPHWIHERIEAKLQPYAQ
jgi:murein DD-endopeptidase MepM/ murein hydrolase activator NlpD/Na+-transporting methylmalonyl-CoA/oxaloacetate decarboxylase gamma subunit